MNGSFSQYQTFNAAEEPETQEQLTTRCGNSDLGRAASGISLIGRGPSMCYEGGEAQEK